MSLYILERPQAMMVIETVRYEVEAESESEAIEKLRSAGRAEGYAIAESTMARGEPNWFNEQIKVIGKKRQDGDEQGVEATDEFDDEREKCPVCGSEAREYQDRVDEEDCVGFRWTCKGCGSKGIEWHELSFLWHTVTLDTTQGMDTRSGRD